jgi:hypothetical protein
MLASGHNSGRCGCAREPEPAVPLDYVGRGFKRFARSRSAGIGWDTWGTLPHFLA